MAGWDDPRMPTLAGLRRRGVPPEAIREFVRRIGVARANSTVDLAIYESAVRDVLNRIAPRRMAVLRPLKLVIENYPEGQERAARRRSTTPTTRRRHPADPVRPRALYRARRFHRKSAEQLLPAGAGARGAAALCLFRDLPRGREERGRRDRRAALHLRPGDPRRQCAGRAARCAARSIGSRRRMLSRPRSASTTRCSRAPTPAPDGDLLADLNPDSLETLTEAMVEPALAARKCGRDRAVRAARAISAATRTRRRRLVFNRTIGLRDSWAKAKSGG